jgi:hypothetical protein
VIEAILMVGYVVSFCAGFATFLVLDDRRGWNGRPAVVAGLGVLALGPVVAPVAIAVALWAGGRWLTDGVGEVRDLLRCNRPAALPEARALPLRGPDA